jgi:cation diffusion facilitator CzcD-associated flavoprotein CzcO
MIAGTDVAIIGAGPYGLSLAAHLQTAGVDFRIFGRAMDAWREHMPRGMLLKSDGFASNLSDPKGEYPLSRFCRERGVAYDDERIAVRLDTFVDYGIAFAKRFASQLKDSLVVSLAREGDGFSLRLANGEVVRARRAVVAVGVGRFPNIPTVLAKLESTRVSHSYDVVDPSTFAGRRVAVIGAGASAIDLAGLVRDQDAEVDLICRADELKFSGRPSEGTLPDGSASAIRVPASGPDGVRGSAPTRRCCFMLCLRLFACRSFSGTSARPRIGACEKRSTGASRCSAAASWSRPPLTASG